MNVGVILAGGVGVRAGFDRPKQFVEVLGKPVVAYTLEAFESHPDIDAIEVVCVESHIDVLRGIVDEHGFSKVRWITPGGATFTESVWNGTRALEGQVAPDDILAFHFAASPFVSADIIADALRVAAEKGNAISTTNFLYLSGLKDADGEKSSTYVDRTTLASMNSPHAFRFDFILNMYREAYRTGVIDEVEPHTTTLMYKMGLPVYFSKGSQTNIKITNHEDIDLLEGFVLMKQRRAVEG